MSERKIVTKYPINVMGMLPKGDESVKEAYEKSIREALFYLFTVFARRIKDAEESDLLSVQYTIELSMEEDKWDAQFVLALLKEENEQTSS